MEPKFNTVLAAALDLKVRALHGAVGHHSGICWNILHAGRGKRDRIKSGLFYNAFAEFTRQAGLNLIYPLGREAYFEGKDDYVQWDPTHPIGLARFRLLDRFIDWLKENEHA